MSKQIVAVGGVPGTGKSTLMKSFMNSVEGAWIRSKPYDLLDSEFNATDEIWVLGKYDEGETFPGTDRLSMAVQPKAVEWIKNYPGDLKLVFEGDRLFNGSFLRSILEMTDVELKVLYLTVPQETITERFVERGSDQNEQFLRSRQTKYENLLCSFDLMDVIEESQNLTLKDLEANVQKIKAFLII